jgi:hypothetical protein
MKSSLVLPVPWHSASIFNLMAILLAFVTAVKMPPVQALSLDDHHDPREQEDPLIKAFTP